MSNERKPTKFEESNREQFERTKDAGFVLLPLPGPFATRTDPTTGKVRQLGKAPRDRGWTDGNYDSDATIAECFPAFINMGYIIKDGVGGLDVDERNAGPQSLKKLREMFPEFDPTEYPRVKSGGGTGAGGHLLFKLPPGTKLKKSLDGDGFPGVEPVCIGRQLVAPGSVHPDTARMYEWDHDHPDIEDGLPDLPPRVLAYLMRPRRDKAKFVGCGEFSNDQMARMLSGLDPRGRSYDDWLKIGMAVHYGTNGDGADVWDEWSARDEERYSGPEEVNAKWDSFATDKDDPVTHRHILKLLAAAGKRNLIPITDFDDLPDEDDDADDWMEGVPQLEDLVERTKADPTAPFLESTLKKLAKLPPAEREKVRAGLQGIGFKRLTELDAAIKKATPKVQSKSKKEGTASLLQRLIGTECDVSMQSDGTVFAQFKSGEVLKCVKVESRVFKEWLAHRLMKLKGIVASDQALNDVIRICVAAASNEGAPTFSSFLRVGQREGAIYVDLCNSKYEVVKITAAGWTILKSHELPDNVRFPRVPSMYELPRPVEDGTGDVRLLRNLINVTPEGKTPSINDDGFVLALSFITSCFTGGPYPILVLDGGAGTAKSTNSELIRMTLDPSAANTKSAPKSEEALVVGALSSYVQCFDNLSHINTELSDQLCRLTTGSGITKRKLYTDADDITLNVRRPIIMNGLHSDMMQRNDLLDRSLIVTLKKLKDIKTEAQLKCEFNAAMPRILAGLFDMVAFGLKRLPEVSATGAKTRLADFERWSTACEAFLWKPGTFLRAFMAMRAHSKELLLKRSPVAKSLIEFMKERECWEGTAEELNQALYNLFEFPEWSTGREDSTWPGAEHIFSRRLRDAAGMLSEVYHIEIDFDRSAAKRLIRVQNLDAFDFG